MTESRQPSFSVTVMFHQQSWPGPITHRWEVRLSSKGLKNLSRCPKVQSEAISCL